ncbi:MAG TPA: hypothetical protein VLX64_00690, partial [Thermoplasmata archaeon]|nr:hypothetical protein [Thermoplasmata archaeon]
MDAGAETPDGWLLDVTESPDGRSVVRWVKERASGRVRRSAVEYRPPFLVTGPRERLADLARRLADDPRVAAVARRSGRPSLYDRRPRPVLAVVPARHAARRTLARAIDALGGFVDFSLYDVDLTAPQLYHFDHGLYPFAPVVDRGGTLVATEPAEAIDYAPPPLSVARFEVRIAGERRGRIPPPDGRIGAVTVGDVTLEGPEDDLLPAVVTEIARADPDILLSDGGDSFDLPWLYRRAAALGLGPDRFVLGREAVALRAARPASTFESYGRIL